MASGRERLPRCRRSSFLFLPPFSSRFVMLTLVCPIFLAWGGPKLVFIGAIPFSVVLPELPFGLTNAGLCRLCAGSSVPLFPGKALAGHSALFSEEEERFMSER